MDEAMRHRIHSRFEADLGSEEAAAVMTAISQASTIDERFDRLEQQLAELRNDFHQEIHQLYRWTIGSVFAALSLGLAATHLIG
jgi:hypothetical protein